MEKEQLEKKVEWLDAERRKALESVASLEKRLASLEKSQTKRESSSQTLSTYKKRLDAFEKGVADLEKRIKAQQTASKKQAQGLDMQAKQLEKSFQQETKGISNVVEDFREEVGKLQSLQKTVNTHGEKFAPLGSRVDALKESIQEVITGEQKRAQLAESLEQASKEDAQRLTQMHADVAALLTRLESAGKQTEGIRISQRKVEQHMEEMLSSEKDRKDAQQEFLQQASLANVERERVWKEWGQRFQVFEQQSAEIAERLSAVEATEQAVKRAQTAFDELSEKIGRRVNELNEIQRLGDQRFRQEWSTFQADAQKRWSNFTLSQEEQQRERVRQVEKLGDQMIQLEDAIHDIQEGMQHLGDQSERTLQAMLEMARDALAENERFVSNSH